MKIVAVTQRLLTTAEYPEVRDALDIRWADFFSQLNVLPIPLPTHFKAAVYFDEINIEAVVFTGGNNLSQFDDNELSRTRDRFEFDLLKEAIQRRLPVIGVCRGMQLIAQYFHCSLSPTDRHVRTRHRLSVNRGSRYAALLERQSEVNSFHTYLVTALESDFIASAHTVDGDMEAFEHSRLPVFGQMWHPERETPFHDADLALFNYIISGAI